MGSLGSVACAEADGHKIILRMNSWSSIITAIELFIISDLSPKRIPARTLRRGYISEFLSMAKTVQPQGFALQSINDFDGFDYMDVSARIKK